MAIALIKMRQLYGKHSRLQFINTTVIARIFEHIFFFRPIVAQGTHHSGQFIIVSRHAPRIAQCAKILAWIEAMPSRMSERACPLLSIVASMRLRIVFYEQKVIFFAQATYEFGIGTASIKMHYEDSTSLWRDGMFYQRIVNLQRISVRFYKYWIQAIIRNGQHTCNVRVGRDNYLIPFMQPAHLHISTKDETQRIKSIGTPYRMATSDILSI